MASSLSWLSLCMPSSSRNKQTVGLIVAEIATAARDAARAESDPLAQLRAGCIAWLELALDPLTPFWTWQHA